jgi:ribosomal protein S2
MINKKLKIINNKKKTLLNSLFKSKNFFGESLNKTNKDILPFIYGIRHGYSIINLKYTIYFFKRIINLINNIFRKKKKILIVGNTADINFLLKRDFVKNNKNIIFFNKKWINGILTNKNISSILKKKKIDLIFVIKSSSNEKYFFKEIFNSKIPLIAFADTNQSLKYINYPIITNCRNIKSLFLLMYLIRKAI